MRAAITDKRDISIHDSLTDHDIQNLDSYFDAFYRNDQFNINCKIKSGKLKSICDQLTPCLNSLKAMNGTISVFNQQKNGVDILGLSRG